MHRIPTVALALTTVSWLGACAIDPGPTTIRVDGDVREWPAGHRAVADDEFVYVRFAVPEARTLQASGVPTRILIDADASGETGHAEHGVGAELEIALSPEGRGFGSAVRAFDETGEASDIGHAAIDFHFAPTYAATQFEARFSRRAWAMGGLADAGGQMRGVVVSGEDASPFTLAVHPAGEPTVDETRVPPTAAGCVRVVSWNVLRGAPDEQPKAFGRVIKALAPDIVLVQEWDERTSDELAAWFGEHAGGAWSAATLPRSGVGVVTKHALIDGPAGPVEMGEGWPARCVGAVVRTPMGEILCSSVHLKCCGSAGSDEDIRREAEARAIGRTLPGMFPAATPDTVIIGGDLNLVGSRPAIDILAETLDVDGSSLAIAEPRVLSDGSAYTWSEDDSSFTPGRLDWVLVGDQNASIERAFVLDARRLSDAALAEAGVERGDTSVSDHLPVVVDVRIR
ncbi:MAG: endonuclease/exonuclease/phosphatase family protein [Phycisphaerales bacterium]